jgi:hypothetical protein
MSPLAFHRKIQTNVRLNPPAISYVTQPESTATIAHLGSTTLTGVATVNFINGGIGTLGYEWRDQNGVIGVGTELTLSNLTAADDASRTIFQRAIYYPDTTRSGIQTFEPGAGNSPLDSDNVTLDILSVISITSQPDAEGGDEYGAQTLTVSPATPNGTTEIDLSTGDFSDFARAVEYTLTPVSTVVVNFALVGGRGGAGESNDGGIDSPGGDGGRANGKVTLQKGYSYKLIVGTEGQRLGGDRTGSPGPRFIDGGGLGSGEGGDGGGFTGLFVTSATHENALLIAGGGGGAASGGRVGGAGGGLEGAGADGGGGGTQTTGGNGYYFSYGDLYAFMNGRELRGGDAQGYLNENPSESWVYADNEYDGGGGGGGYYGGGAGRSDSNGTPGSFGGGGGSGYIHPTLVSDGTFGPNDNDGSGEATLSKVS